MTRMYIPALAALLAAATTATAFAGTVPLPQAARSGKGITAAVALDTTYLSGEAREHVFFDGYSEWTFPDKRRHQLSRLDWDLENVFLLGLSGSVRSDFVSLNFGLWGGLGGDNAGTMEDYDWMMGDSAGRHGPLPEGASEYSRSDATVTGVWMADANVSFDLLDKDCAFAVFPFAGLRYERFEWEDKLDYLVYSSLGWERLDYGGEKSIEYWQEFFQPYLGLGASWTEGRLTLSAYGRFAFVYLGKDHDNHLLRDYVTEDETRRDAFHDVAYGLGVRAEWAFTGNLSASAGIDWTRYALAEADVDVLAQDDAGGGSGEKGFGESLAGMELEYLALSVGLSWHF